MIETRDDWAVNLALIELLRGDTEAPRHVLRACRDRGFVKLRAGVPRLTAAGRRRAVRKQSSENNYRLLLAPPGDRAPLCTVAGSGLHT
jgi:hypothetical protein